MKIILLSGCITIFTSFSSFAVENTLVGNTLICQVFKDEYNHGAVPEVTDWRMMKYLYLTDKNMFTQNATKEIKTGKVHGGTATSMGAVFEWNKVTSGNAGLNVKFRTFAALSRDKISYEIEYAVKHTLADNVNMNVAETGEIYKENGGWRLFSEAKQSLPGGRQPAIYNTKSWYYCEKKAGRHLL